MNSAYINQLLRSIPEEPGIYQYFNDEGVILYIGKAKNLKKRVSSYFNKIQDNQKTKLLVKQINEINYIVVKTDLDALLLENSLIKKHQPKYNIQLKDDKTYPWICIKKEPFPRVFSTRNRVKDGSLYFGPYANVKIVYTLLKLIKELYPLRTCNLDLSPQVIAQKKHKVCLEYHIGNCKAPCIGIELEVSYDVYIDSIQALLKGRFSSIIQQLKSEMMYQASIFKYEEAQAIKDKVHILESYRSKSSIVSSKIAALDVISILEDECSFFINYLVIFDGSIIHGLTLEVKKKLEETKEDVLIYVLLELRDRFQSSSKEVLVEETMTSQFEEFKFVIPRIGEKKLLIELSQRNTKFFRLDKLKQESIQFPEKSADRILDRLRQDLRLSEKPIHIECFDNSNTQGSNAVSACVVFKNGKPFKKDYRHFNVKTVDGPDDFATMEEVVYRRYSRILHEKQSLPQLIVIDGGKGQLGAALKALDKLELRGQIAIIGIAKRLEEIFFPGDQYPIYLDKRSESLKLIQHLRNEAHRFGITHHRNRRSNNAFVSELSLVDGIGDKTYEKLMRHFKTISAIKLASESDLVTVVGKAKALLVFNHFLKD